MTEWRSCRNGTSGITESRHATEQDIPAVMFSPCPLPHIRPFTRDFRMRGISTVLPHEMTNHTQCDETFAINHIVQGNWTLITKQSRANLSIRRYSMCTKKNYNSSLNISCTFLFFFFLIIFYSKLLYNVNLLYMRIYYAGRNSWQVCKVCKVRECSLLVRMKEVCAEILPVIEP